jgi:hypothetical protein
MNNMELISKTPLFNGKHYDIVHEYDDEEGLVTYKLYENIIGDSIIIQTMEDIVELKQIINVIERDINHDYPIKK